MSEDGYDLSRRKVLLGIGTAGVASAGAGAGTFAYFSDTESSTDNQIQAGTLDLEVGADNSLNIDVSDGAPGDSWSSSADLANVGSIGGELSVGLNVTSGPSDGDSSDPEVNYPQSGGLLDEAWVRIGIDGSTVVTKGSIKTADMLGRIDALQRLSGESSKTMNIEVGIDSNALNEIQGDSLTFEVVVGLHQRTPIDASNYNSLQAAIDGASQGETVYVPGGTYTEDVTITTQGLQVLGDGEGSVTVEGRVDIDADDVVLGGMTVDKGDTSGKGIEVNGNAQGTKTSPGVTGVTIKQVTVKNSSDQRGLSCGRCGSLVLKDVTSTGHGNDGVTLWYTYDSRLENVVANDNGDNGIYFNGDNNALIHGTAKRNTDEGVDVNWYDDSRNGQSQQQILLDEVTAEDNGEDDIELHDNGSNDSVSANSMLIKNSQTGGAPTGLRLVQVADSEVQTVNSSFPNGQVDGNDNDVDP